jgi:hypothetical protein
VRRATVREASLGRSTVVLLFGVVLAISVAICAWLVLSKPPPKTPTPNGTPISPENPEHGTRTPVSSQAGSTDPHTTPATNPNSDPSGKNPTAGSHVTGTVHARGGAPIAAARVHIALADNGQEIALGDVTTSSDGTYALATPALDTLDTFAFAHAELRASVLAEHFRPSSKRQALGSQGTDRAQKLDLRLEPGQRLTGRAVDEAGKPVAAANVVLSVANVKDGITTFAPVEEVATASDGRFDVGFASSARYHVALRADGVGTGFLEALDLVAGDDKNLGDIVLKGGPGITGVVHHVDGSPVKHFELWAIDGDFAIDVNGLALAVRKAPDIERGDGLSYARATTDDEGRYALRALRPGHYVMRSPDPHAILEPHQLRFESGTTNLELTLDNTRLIVRVHDEKGTPLRGAAVSLTELAVLADGSYEPSGTRTAAAEGPNAIASFCVDADQPFAIQAFTSKARSTEELVTIAQNEFERVHEAVISRGGGTGRLKLVVMGVDGQPLEQLRVSLAATITRSRLEDIGVLETDAAGMLPPIRAGTYLIDVGFAPGTDRDHLTLHPKEPVEIRAGETRELTLVAHAGGRIALTLGVRGAHPPGLDDAPPANASPEKKREFEELRRRRFGAIVTATLASGGSPRALNFHETDSRNAGTGTSTAMTSTVLPGQTALTEEILEPGDYVLSLTSPGFRTATANVRVLAGRSATVAVDLFAP